MKAGAFAGRDERPYLTVAGLRADLARLGLATGDIVLVHAACSRVGRVLGGPDGIIAALLGTVGPAGTLMAVLDWDTPWEVLRDDRGRPPERWRPEIAPFSAGTTRAARKNGVLPEFLRTTRGACRSDNPGASVVALGAYAADLTRDHALDYGYGPDSPFDRLVRLEGKVLLLGAPFGSTTLLHHAEHLAQLPDKRIDRKELPIATPGGTIWRMSEEFETGEAVAPCLPPNSFSWIVRDYVAAGHGRQGRVGEAPSLLLNAGTLVPFAVAWMEDWAARHADVD
ncbi:aminoglycoside 3-N-acetyltransferase [Sphingomonas sp. OV641]|uniref:aminoglycoside 3-N-acetyltransferase n=1 Tax=Sphingomonas sp. OV641 TaxID=1881068 RepID=UPI0008D0A28D|nr:aminoglycoside 3-N-acetyltransferase [Sphingomonas sp. OV641]SEK02730.1 aminoglycoside 3-N-acetyltransferase [Sphingomonas sp. OV641]